jgi:stearoyl-CoA desaturase (delta-9 desaturase)
MQRGVLSWTANHRDHHKFSDTELDQHSPVTNSFTWSHLGWTIGNKVKTKSNIGDLKKFPELIWLDRYWLLAAGFFFLFTFLVGGLVGLAYGGFLATVLLWHFTFMVNSVCHKYGSRRFNTPDNSRNVWWLAVMTLGECWQNSHHHYQYSANQGMHWTELDISYWVIKFLEKTGLIWSVKTYRPDSPCGRT